MFEVVVGDVGVGVDEAGGVVVVGSAVGQDGFGEEEDCGDEKFHSLYFLGNFFL